MLTPLSKNNQLSKMLRDQINVNTYLNVIIAITLAFFGYVGLQYENRFDSIDARFSSFDSRFSTFNDRFSSLENSLKEDIKENGRKIDRLISTVNDLKVMKKNKMYYRSMNG